MFYNQTKVCTNRKLCRNTVFSKEYDHPTKKTVRLSLSSIMRGVGRHRIILIHQNFHIHATVPGIYIYYLHSNLKSYDITPAETGTQRCHSLLKIMKLMAELRFEPGYDSETPELSVTITL